MRFARMPPKSAYLFRLAITVLAFAALIKFTKFADAFAAIRRVELLPATGAVLLLLVCVPILAKRWQTILGRLQVRIGLWQATRIIGVSSFAGLLLPSSSGGDFVRGAILNRTPVPLNVNAGSILLDRLCGLASMAFFTLPGAIFLWRHTGSVIFAAIAVCAAAVVVGTSVIILVLPVLAERLRRLPPSRGAKAHLIQLIVGSAPVLSPRTVAVCVALSLASQGISILAALCAGAAVHAGAGSVTYFAVMPVIWLATMVPLTVSGLGVREAGFGFLFATAGATSAEGMAVGAVVSAATITAAALGGLLLLIPQRARYTSPGL